MARNESVDVQKLLDDREVDAALYLLQRMLDLPPEELGAHRARLMGLQSKVTRKRRLTKRDKKQVLDSYRALLG